MAATHIGGWGDCCGFGWMRRGGMFQKLPVPLELLLLAPDAADHVERLVPDGAGVAGVDLEALLLVGVAPARAEVDAPA